MINSKSRAELRKHFDFFDDDNNGFIDFDEYADLLKIMGVQLASGRASALFASVDRDSDGRVSFDEFVAWWRTDWYID